MCGRYTLRASPQQMALAFHVNMAIDLHPRYNIAPTQQAPVVRSLADGNRELAELRWGLIPRWATDRSIGSRMINARSETAATKPAFREAMRERRCLIPADGFYEWQKQGGQKHPMFVHCRDDAPFAFAGLWEHWTDEQHQPLETFTILTAPANDQLRPLHDRMPIIIRPENYQRWLDPTMTDAAAVEIFLADPPEDLVLQPVGSRVNSVANDDPTCIVPVRAQKTLWD
ncbi:MAG TPA: SOS response-associated peptidase [Pirellulales bacterium]|jgi:putative SOS response-associated peptidase YedK|nr:SOS response-associated peptidase [Pirellulales bacterium]